MAGPAGPPLFNSSYRYLHPDASKCPSLQLEVSLRTCVSEGHPVKNREVFSCENAGSGTGTLSSCSFAVTRPRLLEAPTSLLCLLSAARVLAQRAFRGGPLCALPRCRLPSVTTPPPQCLLCSRSSKPIQAKHWWRLLWGSRLAPQGQILKRICTFYSHFQFKFSRCFKNYIKIE